MKLFVVDQDGSEHVLNAEDGQKVMEAIRDAGLRIAAQCGGCCSCATCHVYVEIGWTERLPPMGEDEESMLELAVDPMPNSRLSCQLVISERLSGLRLRLAPGTEL